MLYRKIEKPIRDYLSGNRSKVLVVEGARQIGKSYIIRHVGKELFENFIELNLVEDKAGPQLFANVSTISDFYLRMSLVSGENMDGNRENTLVFIDEIQEYPQLLTLLKFLNADARYTYVASGSLLGVTLGQTTSIPVGSIRIMDMFPLDFEEFMLANSVGKPFIDEMRRKYIDGESLDDYAHNKIIDLWRKYLVVGGMPDAVNAFLETSNFTEVRSIQNDIIRLYAADASKYDHEHKLLIKRIYDMIPSNMENKKKRVVAKKIENKDGGRFANYMEEFEYLISSGIALEAIAISNPKYPLSESVTKNLIKLYLNDTGLLTSILYGNDIISVLDDKLSINLGAVYETAIATQLRASGYNLYYYDNKKKGEVDYIVNDRDNQTVLPIEVKSGRDYRIHSAINALVSNQDYGIKRGIVLSNEREIIIDDKIIHLPIYYSPFI